MTARLPLGVIAAAFAALVTAAARAELPADGAGLSGLYAGSYMCQDGEHGVILDLSFFPRESGEGLEVAGAIGFVPVLAGLEGTVGDVAGSFKITGAAYPNGRLLMRPGDWIVQPDGYGAAGLTGHLTQREDGLWSIEGTPAAGPDQCSALIAVKPFD